MRIAFLAAELAPFAQVGGLGDVARSLPGALASAGEEVLVLVPGYADRFPEVAHLGNLDLGPMGPVTVSRLGGEGPEVGGEGPEVWLIGSEQWFGDESIYTESADEHLRFGAFTAGAVAAAAEWRPDVVHLNDWHTALGALHLEALDLGGLPTVLTIHNLAFQGQFPLGDLERLGLGAQSGLVVPGGGEVNALATGIACAAVVTTVSPTHAREITTQALGFGLQDQLRARGDDVVGILNGVGEEWKPSSDHYIPEPFSVTDVLGKVRARDVLTATMGLRSGDGPILGIVSRLTHQKGLDLVEPALESLLTRRTVRLVVLGMGEEPLEDAFSRLEERHPGGVAFAGRFDVPLAHLVMAGSDMLLMPSRFEPCGLNQMYAMRYGTVPIVHRVGGLADTVTEWDPAAGHGTGFTFEPCEVEAMRAAVGRALDAFDDREQWLRLMRSGMIRDDSWSSRVPAYQGVYRRATG